jgi:hypothetical protein
MSPKASKAGKAREDEATNVFYVKAEKDPADPKRVSCTFFKDFDCRKRAGRPLRIPRDAGEVIFVHVPTLENLLLVGALADRVDTTIVDPSYQAAVFNQVSVPMPTEEPITQGILLIYSSQGNRTQLYSSADPIVENNDT